MDGVRGVAILLVFVAHLLSGVFPEERPLFAWLPSGGGGGFIGVQLFFVLSGFLITSILLREFEATGDISLKGFYIRRIRRLYPALIMTTGAYLVVAALLRNTDWPAALGAAGRALTYTSNLDPLLRWAPDTGWLNHTWSLAVEEQFYLVWPPCVLVLLRRGRRWPATVAAVGVVVAVGLRLLPRLQGIAYEAIRWDALMIGCLLSLSGYELPRRLSWFGVPILGYYAVVHPHPITTWDYLLGSAGSALFLAYARGARWVTHPWLARLGVISYSLYLWHILIMRLGWSGWINLPLSLLAAEASYRFVEQPWFVTRGAPSGPADAPARAEVVPRSGRSG